MNKKFLSAVLFGAMLATTTSTFVSCKDYDDDIAGLQEQIDGVKSNLTSEVASLRGELATAKSELQNELTSTKNDLASAKSDLEAAKAAVNTNTGNISALQTKVSTLESKVATLESKVATIESKITAIDTLASDLEALSNDLEDAKATNTEALNGIANKINALDEKYQDIIGKTLTSLVLNPELYYGGIEAVMVSTIEYTALELDEVNANEDFSDDAAEEADEVQMTPTLSATYHMNPSSAVVPEDLNSYKFLIADKEYKPFMGGARTATEFNHEILSAIPSNGDLTVTAKFTNDAFATGDEVTTLALEVKIEEGKVVTSDYAAVYAEAITGFVLNNEDSKEAEAHLYTTAADAIENEAIVNVAWNETVDLAKYVETHYLSEDGCADLAETTLKGYGFEYKYELVGYFEGDNKTSQSAHAALKGSVLRPQLPNADGTAAAWSDKAETQNQATIGRFPLVRVTLVDTNSNKNVAVGYVKVAITATPGKNTIGAQANYTFTDKFTLSCAENLEPMIVKWYQIEEQILKELNISKAEFDNNYTLEEGFFTTNDENAEEKTVTGVTVEETTSDIEGNMTEVLQMTVDAEFAYNHFLTQESITVIVRYAKENGVDALGAMTYDYVYVTLNWKPAERNVNPVGTIANADKIKEYWFADDNNQGGTGYNEIHVNVNVPGEGQDAVSTSNFKKNMLHTFVDGDITISGVAEVYKDFQDLTTTLEFAETQSTPELVGNDGKTYRIKRGSEETTQLYAYELINGVESTEGHKIATIKNDGTIVYQNTQVSKALLNAAGRNELAKNVTATVLVKEANECGKSLIELTNNTFDVKFLRPISVTQADMDKFEDGVDVGAEGSVVDLQLNFTDWRGYEFVDSYFKHYGVTGITADTDNATTNVSGEWDELPAGMTISYNDGAAFAPETVGEYGQVKYINNNAEVGNFSIKVPFTVTYVWGTIKFEVEFQVAKTVNKN